MNLKTGSVVGMVLLAMGTSTQAALLSRAGGQAYYDDVSNITWIADANLAGTSGYDNDGYMNWDKVQKWIGTLNSANYLGVNDWRLPLTAQPDASCSVQDSFGSYGYGCTGSEMGRLYHVDGISSSAPGPLSNVQPSTYWSGTPFAPDSTGGWHFYFNDGYQDGDYEASNAYAWAVRDGDIAAVPVPAAGWLFACAMGLMGLTRRKAVSR